MSATPSKELLRDLSLAAGPPGFEHEVRAIVKKALSPVGTVSHDRLGSLLCEKRGASATPRVVLDAHMDEVAFLVRNITVEGRLRVVPLGGWWGHVLLAQRMNVLTEKGKIPGIFGCKPPHFLTASEKEKVQNIDDMLIDIGASCRKEAEELGIRIGDPVVPHAEFIELAAPDMLSGKAFDDRAGVGVLCETMQRLALCDHPNTVVAVAAVQEEVGCRGAATASELSRPDVAIVLEGTPADDLPGSVESERQAGLGSGPQVRYFDPTAISNRRLVTLVEEVAAREKIDLQRAVRRSGGTNASSIHTSGAGVPTVVIGVPARYIHTHVSVISFRDYARTIDLVTAVVQALDKKTAEGLVTF
jgi:endoglucanase